MPPEIPPPDDERRPSPSEGNVVDSKVLAERRAQRAEQAEQSAARRAADAQVLAAELARERARLEAERDAARAEASAAREGADAAIAEARHLQTERDTLRTALDEARAERDALAARAAVPRAPADDAPTASEPAAPDDVRTSVNGSTNGAAAGHSVLPPSWPAALRRELTVARTAAAIASPGIARVVPTTPVPGLARERRLVAQRAASGPKVLPGGATQQRRGDRAAPITALALERERSSRLQAQLDSSLAVQRELRTHIAALQRAVHQRVEAERRIETALRRVREELTAASTFAAEQPKAPVQPVSAHHAAAGSPPGAAAGTAAPGVVPMPPADADASAAASTPRTVVPAIPASQDTPSAPAAAVAPSVPPASTPSDAPPVVATSQVAVASARTATLDPLRLSAARERLRAAAPAVAPLDALPAGPPAPWLAAALQGLLASEPATAGRIVVGLLPAQGLVADRPLRYDLLLAGRGCLAVDVEPGGPVTVVPRSAPRPHSARDLSVAGDAAGLARLLHGRRKLLRRPARVRGGRKALRELRRLARAPLGVRDLGSAGVTLEPALALRLVALAIDPAATRGERFTIAHAPLAGGPVDAWLRIADGGPPEVCDSPPAEPTRLTFRCTRGALLALIAGVEPPAGESGSFDGDDAALTLLRNWIAQTEHPAV
ncbi:MAG TPA: hypothetical protein VKB03_01080 [Conexibacter sp.]|nr:hypothetical protein [Conexibacter sp.]